MARKHPPDNPSSSPDPPPLPDLTGHLIPGRRRGWVKDGLTVLARGWLVGAGWIWLLMWYRALLNGGLLWGYDYPIVIFVEIIVTIVAILIVVSRR